MRRELTPSSRSASRSSRASKRDPCSDHDGVAQPSVRHDGIAAVRAQAPDRCGASQRKPEKAGRSCARLFSFLADPAKPMPAALSRTLAGIRSITSAPWFRSDNAPRRGEGPAPSPRPAIQRLSCRCVRSASNARSVELQKQKTPRRAFANYQILLGKFGAGDGIRTHDPNLGKVPQALAPHCEELRLSRINYRNQIIFFLISVAEPPRWRA